MGGQTGELENAVDDVGQIALAELMGGQVHRYPDIPQSLFMPLARLAAGAFQHQLADGGDQAGLLRQGDELRRR